MSINLITLTDIQLAFGHHPLLDGASITIHAGERCGLIGRNGAGKSSLLKLLDGRLQPDDGQIMRSTGLQIATVEQEPELPPDQSIYDYLCADFTETEDWQRPARVNTLIDQLGLPRRPHTNLIGWDA